MSPVFIPPYEVEAEIGFSVEYINHRYGGMEPLAEALKKGDILGIVNIVGCNNPKVIYERAIVDVAEEMLKNNILILTNGCASFPLLKLGFCHPDARSKCGEGLRRFLDEDMPPAWTHGRMYRQHQSQRRVCRDRQCVGPAHYRYALCHVQPRMGQ